MNHIVVNTRQSLQDELSQLQLEMMKKRREKSYEELESLERRVDRLHQELNSVKEKD